MTTSEKFTVPQDSLFLEKFYMNGTAALNGTLANSAVVDNGDGTVGIAITAHGLAVGNGVLIAGTTNYDGYHVIQSVDTNVINVTATYVAETPAGTETYVTAFKFPPGSMDWRLVNTLLVLSDVGGAGDYEHGVDAYKGASWDEVFNSTDMTALARYFNDLSDKIRVMLGGDILYFTYPNAGAKVWGIEILVQRLL